MSGGGRCNFTNTHTSPDNFLSDNPHFCKSALTRYTQFDFITLVEQYGIAYHEKTLGQLFCDNSAQDIVRMLEEECKTYGATVTTRCDILQVQKTETGFAVTTSRGLYQCKSLVVATGGLSMPKLGATPLGYQLAEQFGLTVLPTQAALVPYTLHDHDKQRFEELSGVSTHVVATAGGASFSEDMLFTHRGLSGPSMLQTSSYWRPGDSIVINFFPSFSSTELIEQWRYQHNDALLSTCLASMVPKRLAASFVSEGELHNKPIKQMSDASLKKFIESLCEWEVRPNATEGYRTAEVTLGGVDTKHLSSKTMMAKDVEGLYFIGEVVDVTGWLGGYNFQWAWSSGWAAGQVV